MRTNELQIYNWVKFEAKYLSGKTEIHNTRIDDVIGRDNWNIVHLKDWAWNVYAKDLMPIPLTEDILKLNGFIFKELTSEWQHYVGYPVSDYSDFQVNDSYDEDADEWCVSIKINGFDYNIHYVHELQNILRVCGLFDFADNFKITEEEN